MTPRLRGTWAATRSVPRTIETSSRSISCHDSATDELYTVVFTPKEVRVSSYSADAILARIETWADGKTALA